MKKLLLLSVVCLAATGQVALAEDLQPPWWRGQWSTTSQIWEFLQPGVPGDVIAPDGPAPGGQPPLPSTHVVVDPGPYPPWDGWMSQDSPVVYDGKTVGLGVWPLSGWMDVTVDNHDPVNPEKWIWVQLTWRPQDHTEEPILEALYPPPTAGPKIVEEIILDSADPLGWRETTYFWKLDWNPPVETFTITGTINVDELVIDTWCIPEPATLALLVLGTCLTLRKRRSR